jgi:rRNA maturation protein Nop10
VTRKPATAVTCPHCGVPLHGGAAVAAPPREAPYDQHEPTRYDLEQLATLASSEKAYDETVKVRVTQEDIRKLVEKRKKKPK